MGELYYPFATGAGANADEIAWGNIFLASGFPGVIPSDVLWGHTDNRFAVTQPSNGTIQVDTGRAYCFGRYYELTSAMAGITVPNNGTGSVRYDRVVIRFNFQSGSSGPPPGDTATVMVIPGVTGPELAPLSKARGGLYDVPIATLATQPGNNPVVAVHMALDRFVRPPGYAFTVCSPFPSQAQTRPENSIICGGQTVSRLDYERLWTLWHDVAGQEVPVQAPRNYGTIDGANPLADSIVVPDLRGRTWTGLDNLAGNGPANRLVATDLLGRGMGHNALADSALPAHTHGIADPDHGGANSNYQGILTLDPGGTSGLTATPNHPVVAVHTSDIYNNNGSHGRTNTWPETAQDDDSLVSATITGSWIMLA